MIAVSSFKTNNPFVIAPALIVNGAASVVKLALSAAYLAVAAAAATIGHAFATILPAILWLLRTLLSDGGKVDKPTRLAIALTAIAFGAMLVPAVTAGVVLVAVFAVVSKPK